MPATRETGAPEAGGAAPDQARSGQRCGPFPCVHGRRSGERRSGARPLHWRMWTPCGCLPGCLAVLVPPALSRSRHAAGLGADLPEPVCATLVRPDAAAKGKPAPRSEDGAQAHVPAGRPVESGPVRSGGEKTPSSGQRAGRHWYPPRREAGARRGTGPRVAGRNGPSARAQGARLAKGRRAGAPGR